jgi:hypothetical protein
MPAVDQQAEYAIAFPIGVVAMWTADLVLEMIVKVQAGSRLSHRTCCATSRRAVPSDVSYP